MYRARRTTERASGQQYERFLQENILDRLDLKQPGSDPFTAIIPRARISAVAG
jgi:CubicO group peptidase (beta-lactamase class C family)